MTLEQFRIANKLTYDQLADQVGIEGQWRGRTMQRYAKGERFPDAHTLARIRDATMGAVSADSFVDSYLAKTIGAAAKAAA
jgi:transcriptional regulator with XRE-family HTH domain